MPSSPTQALARRLEDMPAQAKSAVMPGTMRDVLDSVPDPRKRRGIRYALHALSSVLALRMLRG